MSAYPMKALELMDRWDRLTDGQCRANVVQQTFYLPLSEQNVSYDEVRQRMHSARTIVLGELMSRLIVRGWRVRLTPLPALDQYESLIETPFLNESNTLRVGHPRDVWLLLLDAYLELIEAAS